MPLIVHCPNGCVIRVPLARAGTIVRCSECKSVMQLRPLSPEEASSGRTIEVHALLATASQHGSEDSAAHDSASPELTDATAAMAEEGLISPAHGMHAPSNLHRDFALESEPAAAANPSEEAESNRMESVELPVPQPAKLRFARGRRRRNRMRPAAIRKGPFLDVAEIERAMTRPSDAGEFDGLQLDETYEDRSDDDCRFLSQFYAASIGFMGMVLILPALLAWSGWTVLPVEPTGSRWIFIMIFLGALHIVYGIFLFQIPERAALWSVSLFLLFVACVHGVFTAGTWLDKGNGRVSHFLQLPPTETPMVTLWCFLNLIFSAILCYLCGRLAIRWRNKLLRTAAQSK